jgi:hypothetical protein
MDPHFQIAAGSHLSSQGGKPFYLDIESSPAGCELTDKLSMPVKHLSNNLTRGYSPKAIGKSKLVQLQACDSHMRPEAMGSKYPSMAIRKVQDRAEMNLVSTNVSTSKGQLASLPSPPPETVQPPLLLTRKQQDAYLLTERAKGKGYREIKRSGNLPVSDATLRGRYRTLSKPPGRRVRRPTWQKNDVIAYPEISTADTLTTAM